MPLWAIQTKEIKVETKSERNQNPLIILADRMTGMMRFLVEVTCVKNTT